MVEESSKGKKRSQGHRQKSVIAGGGGWGEVEEGIGE